MGQVGQDLGTHPGLDNAAPPGGIDDAYRNVDGLLNCLGKEVGHRRKLAYVVGECTLARDNESVSREGEEAGRLVTSR